MSEAPVVRMPDGPCAKCGLDQKEVVLGGHDTDTGPVEVCWPCFCEEMGIVEETLADAGFMSPDPDNMHEVTFSFDESQPPDIQTIYLMNQVLGYAKENCTLEEMEFLAVWMKGAMEEIVNPTEVPENDTEDAPEEAEPAAHPVETDSKTDADSEGSAQPEATRE